eukprot:108613-Chlamydomonas_euryale.AAC.6
MLVLRKACRSRTQSVVTEERRYARSCHHIRPQPRHQEFSLGRKTNFGPALVWTAACLPPLAAQP